MATLPALATADDVVARLGRSLNQVETARIDALLDDGSAIIRRFARRPFIEMKDDTVTVRAGDGIIKLPGRPIASVKSVTAVAEGLGIPPISVTWFIFDGIDEVTVPEPAYSGIINLPEIWFDIDWFTCSYQVVYTHGDATVPGEVIGLLCQAVISVLVSPTMASGLASETVGAYSYSLRASGGAGIRAALIDAGMESVLADYRTKTGTIQVARP